ncbi:MAG: peptidoglycan-binding protein [Patescibacteria group bacterium]|nr:peptidoglycan-binding protein [Patescibacteria group bacterium]
MKNKVIAIALALTTLAWVAPINGATVEELQAQINALLQQIAQLQAQLAAQGGSTATGCFTKTLQKGMSDPEVTTLQQVLKTDSSIYPEGLVTGYFGSLTEAAVKKFQAKYGLDQVGIVGPATRAKLNSLYCGTAQQTTTTAPTTTPTTAAYGNLSINKVPVANPAYTYYAGGTYELFAGEFKATGSDITVRKIGIDITTSSNMLPWQKFSTISLWEGSTKLAELVVNQANLIENVFASNYTLNVAGLNWVIPNGQKKTLTVKATLLPTLTTSALAASFTVAMNSSTVYTDTAGVVYTTLDVTSKNLSATIGTVGEADRANLIVSLATDNPVKSNVIASTSNTTAVTLLKFTVKNDSNVSATLNRATTTVVVQNTTTTSYVTAVELWDGSTRVQTAAPTWTTTNGAVSWENFTLPIAANTTKTLIVKAIIASIPTTDTTFVAGSYVKASNVWLQGLDANSNIVGSTYTLAGNEQYVFVKAPVFALGTTSFTAAGSADHPQSIGNAKITLGITAYNNDIYIDKTSANTYGTLVAGTTSASTAYNFTCTTNATEEGNYYRISAGSTATCELSAVIQLSTSTQNGFFQVGVGKITWNTSATTTNDVEQTWGWDNFKTGSLYLSY